jgi:[FeFe] hydrogenase (group B1/B3)
MNHNNNASLIKRQVMVRAARLALEGRLEAEADRIAYDMTASGWETIRCCVHHDRAILRLRAMAVLGADPEGLDDSDRPLADYARMAALRVEKAAGSGARAADGRGRVLTVINEACNACVRSRYLVTEACQGCLARPCKMNCPKKAISFRSNRATIEAEACVNCGLCQKNCPYSAIVKIPVPCEEACPVGAIAKTEDGRERIDEDKCVLCGKCLRECPFGAVTEVSELVDLCLELRAGRPLVALIAPAVAVQFPGGLARLGAALKALGFAAVMEVARGAELAAADEARELEESMEDGSGYLATSCCPSWVLTARRHLPDIAPRVSTTPSPLAYAARLAAAEMPGAARVFIGPCVAKRAEALGLELVDRVITAEELGSLFVAAGIDVGAMDDTAAPGGASSAGRAFAASGGAGAAVLAALDGRRAQAGQARTQARALAINGLGRQTVKTLQAWSQSPPSADLVEVMACEGGCIGGPCVLAPARLAKAELDRMAEKRP